MVGRTPEYLGKKLEAKEVKMAMLALLSLPLSILGLTALAGVLPAGLGRHRQYRAARLQRDPLCLYLGTGNNGSAFAGLTANTLFYNTTLAVAMLIGRFIFVIPLLAVAGSLAQKKLLAPSAGHVPDARPALRRAAGRRHPHHRRPDLFPRRRARSRGRAVAMHAGTLYPGP